jgi:hypothetical protein
MQNTNPIVSSYRFNNSTIRVEWRGDDTWAVVDTGMCFNTLGEWEYEPYPSSRSKLFLERTRFSLVKATELAIQEVEKEQGRRQAG